MFYSSFGALVYVSLRYCMFSRNKSRKTPKTCTPHTHTYNTYTKQITKHTMSICAVCVCLCLFYGGRFVGGIVRDQGGRSVAKMHMPMIWLHKITHTYTAISLCTWDNQDVHRYSYIEKPHSFDGHPPNMCVIFPLLLSYILLVELNIDMYPHITATWRAVRYVHTHRGW